MEEFLLAVAIIVSVVLVIVMKVNLRNNKLANAMSVLFALLIIWCTGLLLQKISIALEFHIKPIYFDYLTYIGICFLFPTLIILSFYYNESTVNFNPKWLLLYLIPAISLFFLWTNDFHSLFYKVYSTNINECVYGIGLVIHNIYSYIL